MSTDDVNYEAAILEVAKENRDSAIQKFKASILQKEPSSDKGFGFAVALLKEANNYTQAIGFINDVCAFIDDQFKVNELLAGLWMKLGDFPRAIHFGEQALAINPNDEMLYSQVMCWMANQTSDKREVRQLFESWGKRFMDPMTAAATPLSVSSLEQNKKLKIGYVSGDLRNHAVRFFIEPYLRFHDRDRLSIHVFMTLQEDEVSSILKDTVDIWHSVAGLSDSELYDLIRKLDIDILVDLSGHTDGERLAVFAKRAKKNE
jgi:protein O-GlcNAc transferase